METNPDILAARAKLFAKSGARANTTGKHAPRRKIATHATGPVDDKKIQTQIKKLGVTSIASIEEVNMFKTDGNIMHFKRPKVQVSTGSNTYVINGSYEEKHLQEMLPGIITQMGHDSLMHLKEIAENMDALEKKKEAEKQKKDADIPDVESFDDE